MTDDVGGFQLFVRYEVFLIHGRHHKLRVVNAVITIQVDRSKHGVDHLLSDGHSEMLFVSVKDFFAVERAVAVLVHALEDFLEVALLVLACEVTRDESHRGLLQLIIRLEK